MIVRPGRAVGPAGSFAGLVALALLLGCAPSLVSGGRLREARYLDLVARSADARGIPFEAPVAARVVTAAEVPALVRAALEAEVPSSEIAAYQEALATLGLWPSARSLADVLADVTGEEVAGLYVPRDRTLYVVRDAAVPFPARLVSWLARRDVTGEMVLAHELVHALQHQAYPGYFDRDRFLHGQDDLASALDAALEGDATYYGLVALGGDAGLPDPFAFGRAITRDMESRRRGALADAPAWIRLVLGFPYAAGYALAFREGRTLLETPPASTEQALHAARRREPFTAIDLAAARARLPSGCAAVHENGLGELGLRVLLRDLAPDAARPEREAGRLRAEAAAEGWDGDRYLVVHCEGRRELVWRVLLDDEDEARELEAALAGVTGTMAARGGLAGPPAVWRDGRALSVASPGLAPVADALLGLARRARVSTAEDVLAFFGQPPLRGGPHAVAAREAPFLLSRGRRP